MQTERNGFSFLRLDTLDMSEQKNISGTFPRSVKSHFWRTCDKSIVHLYSANCISSLISDTLVILVLTTTVFLLRISPKMGREISMRQIYRNYQSNIAKLNKWGTWFPGTQLRTGEVGFIKNGVFSRYTTLEELKVHFETESDTPKDSAFSYSSVGIKLLKFDNSLNLGLDTRWLGYFGTAGHFIIVAHRMARHRIKNLREVSENIRKKYKKGEWKREWTLVDDVWTAETYCVILGLKRGTRIELISKDKPVLGILDLIDLNIDLRIPVQGEQETALFRGREGALFFTPRQLRKGWFKHRNILAISTGVASDENREELDIFAYSLNDLLNSWEFDEEN